QSIHGRVLDRGRAHVRAEVRGTKRTALRSDEEKRLGVGGGQPSMLRCSESMAMRNGGTASVRRLAGDFTSARTCLLRTSAIVSATSRDSRKKLSLATRSPTTSDQRSPSTPPKPTSSQYSPTLPPSI